MSSAPARRKRPLDPSRPPVRAGLVAFAAVVLIGLVVLPAFALDRGDGDDAPDAPEPAPATSTTTSTTLDPTPPTTAATEAVSATFASLTDEERVALHLFFMSDEEREAFARFISPPPPPPAPEPAPEPAPVEIVPVEPAPLVEAAPAGSVWDDLAWCEAGGNWAHPPVGSYGYSGGLMFLPSTWTAYGGGEFAAAAHLASRDAQIVVAERILASHGGSYGAWPGCRAKLGLP